MLGWLKWRWLGVFIALNHQNNRWGWLLLMGAPDSPMHQPRHPTVRVLTQSTVRALTSGGTGQALFSVWCAFDICFDFCRELLRCQGHCAVDRCFKEPLLRCHTGQSGGTPESPVNYSGATPEKPEGEEFGLVRSWCTGQSGALDQCTLRFLLPLSFEPKFDLFIALC
jgi:hypothetical protein